MSGTYDINIQGDQSGGNIIGVGTVNVLKNLNVGAGNTGIFASADGNITVTGISTLNGMVSIADSLSATNLYTGPDGIGIGTDTITGNSPLTLVQYAFDNSTSRYYSS